MTWSWFTKAIFWLWKSLACTQALQFRSALLPAFDPSAAYIAHSF